jgi:hypothetical protein
VAINYRLRTAGGVQIENTIHKTIHHVPEGRFDPSARGGGAATLSEIGVEPTIP